MKILIPTDFSKYAEYAIQMGIKIAKMTNAEIHLFHSINHINTLNELSLGKELYNELQEHILDWAKDKIKASSENISSYGILCDTKITKGKYLKTIKDITNAEDYDLIIIGSHGASGKEEWFLGSNASKTVRKLHHNILVVKNSPDEFEFTEAVFVSGLDSREKQSFISFLDLMDRLSIKKIHILTIDTYNYFSQPSIIMKEALEDFKNIAVDFAVETHFYTDYSIHSGIRHFSQEYNISLIGFSNSIRHPLKRMLQGSNVEITVNQSEIPVLSIDNQTQGI